MEDPTLSYIYDNTQDASSLFVNVRQQNRQGQQQNDGHQQAIANYNLFTPQVDNVQQISLTELEMAIHPRFLWNDDPNFSQQEEEDGRQQLFAPSSQNEIDGDKKGSNCLKMRTRTIRHAEQRDDTTNSITSVVFDVIDMDNLAKGDDNKNKEFLLPPLPLNNNNNNNHIINNNGCYPTVVMNMGYTPSPFSSFFVPSATTDTQYQAGTGGSFHCGSTMLDGQSHFQTSNHNWTNNGNNNNNTSLGGSVDKKQYGDIGYPQQQQQQQQQQHHTQTLQIWDNNDAHTSQSHQYKYNNNYFTTQKKRDDDDDGVVQEKNKSDTHHFGDYTPLRDTNDGDDEEYGYGSNEHGKDDLDIDIATLFLIPNNPAINLDLPCHQEDFKTSLHTPTPVEAAVIRRNCDLQRRLVESVQKKQQQQRQHKNRYGQRSKNNNKSNYSMNNMNTTTSTGTNSSANSRRGTHNNTPQRPTAGVLQGRLVHKGDSIGFDGNVVMMMNDNSTSTLTTTTTTHDEVNRFEGNGIVNKNNGLAVKSFNNNNMNINNLVIKNYNNNSNNTNHIAMQQRFSHKNRMLTKLQHHGNIGCSSNSNNSYSRSNSTGVINYNNDNHNNGNNIIDNENHIAINDYRRSRNRGEGNGGSNNSARSSSEQATRRIKCNDNTDDDVVVTTTTTTTTTKKDDNVMLAKDNENYYQIAAIGLNHELSVVDNPQLPVEHQQEQQQQQQPNVVDENRNVQRSQVLIEATKLLNEIQYSQAQGLHQSQSTQLSEVQQHQQQQTIPHVNAVECNSNNYFGQYQQQQQQQQEEDVMYNVIQHQTPIAQGFVVHNNSGNTTNNNIIMNNNNNVNHNDAVIIENNNLGQQCYNQLESTQFSHGQVDVLEFNNTHNNNIMNNNTIMNNNNNNNNQRISISGFVNHNSTVRTPNQVQKQCADRYRGTSSSSSSIIADVNNNCNNNNNNNTAIIPNFQNYIVSPPPMYQGPSPALPRGVQQQYAAPSPWQPMVYGANAHYYYHNQHGSCNPAAAGLTAAPIAPLRHYVVGQLVADLQFSNTENTIAMRNSFATSSDGHRATISTELYVVPQVPGPQIAVVNDNNNKNNNNGINLMNAYIATNANKQQQHQIVHNNGYQYGQQPVGVVGIVQNSQYNNNNNNTNNNVFSNPNTIDNSLYSYQNNKNHNNIQVTPNYQHIQNLVATQVLLQNQQLQHQQPQFVSYNNGHDDVEFCYMP